MSPGEVLSEGRNRTKARVHLRTFEGRPAVEKDYSDRGFFVRRFLGPLLLDREEQALRLLGGRPGFPVVLERPSRDRLVMSFLDGVPLGRVPRDGTLPAGFFARLTALVESMHALGVAQGDIGSGDVLLAPDGGPSLVDFSVSVRKGRGWLRRTWFQAAAEQDRHRVARLHQRWSADDLSAEEQARLERSSPWRDAGHRLRPLAKGPAGQARLIGVFLFLAILAALARPTPFDVWLGLPFVIAGGALRAWAAGYLLKTRALAVDGPYAFSRNPLYLGRLLLLTGFGLMARLPGNANLYLLAFGYLVFFAYYFPRKLRVEGGRLRLTHGAAYDRWEAGVPALLPRLTPYRDAGVPPTGGWHLARFMRNREYMMLAMEAGLVALFALRAAGASPI